MTVRCSLPSTHIGRIQTWRECANTHWGERCWLGCKPAGTHLESVNAIFMEYTYSLLLKFFFFPRENVITTASNNDKLDWLLKMPNGPTHAVNYKTQDFAAEVKKITNGNGVDVIVDFPGQSHFVKNIDSLALDGRMTMLALLSGPFLFLMEATLRLRRVLFIGANVSAFSLAPILSKCLRIQGSTLRSRSPAYQADLINRFKLSVADKLTGANGEGPLRTFIHKVGPRSCTGQCL